MAIKDKVKASAAFNFKDLTFCLDKRMNAKRDRLMQELVTETAKAAKDAPSDVGGVKDQRLGHSKINELKKEIEAHEERMREKSIGLRITAVNNGLWQKWIIQNPPRKGNGTDAALGYNSETFFQMALVNSGQELLTPGTEEEDFADAELGPLDGEDWASLFEVWTAGDWDRVHFALIVLNQREGQAGVDFLSRGSGATTDSEPTSDSPEN